MSNTFSINLSQTAITNPSVYNIYCSIIQNTSGNDIKLLNISNISYSSNGSTPFNPKTGYNVFYRNFNTTNSNSFSLNDPFSFASPDANGNLNIILNNNNSLELMVIFETSFYVIGSKDPFTEYSVLNNSQPGIVILAGKGGYELTGTSGKLDLSTLNTTSNLNTNVIYSRLTNNMLQLICNYNFESLSLISPAPQQSSPVKYEFLRQEPKIKKFSMPTKIFGDDSFEIVPPKSENNSRFSYESSDTSVATISDNNKVNIIKPGKTEIIATQNSSPFYTSATTKTTFEIQECTETNPVIINDGEQLLSFIDKEAKYGKLKSDVIIDKDLKSKI